MTDSGQRIGGARRGGQARGAIGSQATGGDGGAAPLGADGVDGGGSGARRGTEEGSLPSEPADGYGPGPADGPESGSADGQEPGPAGRHEPEPADASGSGPADASGSGPADGQEAAAILEEVRQAVDPALRSALGSLPGAMRRVALYHFGWEHADGTPAAGDSGKAIRPALVLTAAAALGGPAARAAAVRAAAAVELVHNFTLLHDDVMDHDTTRRHRPTAWTVFGSADAILAGDAMQALALRLLAQDPHPASARALARLAACVVELREGQQVDTAMERRAPAEVGLGEVLAMAEAKTGALLGCACAVGALYAGAAEEDVEALDAFGREAGLAFQLIDDVIGIWGDPGHTGKPAGADLAVRKKSLPVVAALTSGTTAAAELAALYELPYAEGDLERTALAVERAGGRDWAQAQAADHMSRAMSELARAVPDPETAGGLLSLAEFVTRRTS
ncbi:family 2 encapsulin nanocompartment cargo protein polyprenyl transferase [Streptomyces sp. NPDC053367]|uniref:family 2 encapsulin nanocompartment cargo protein polyprenyl transferase n=1 Tax=Streptomyces sp. NPDC053367 TaxID=3365700 RepID=UPI0037D85199